MDLITNIKDNTLLIIPNNLKEKVLEELDSREKLVSVKIMSLDDVKKHLLFDYDHDAIIYIMNRYNVKYDIAITYLENMYYLNDCMTSSDKLNELTLIKNTLLGSNILKRDTLFRKYLKNKNVIIYGYDYYTKFDLKIMNIIKEITDTTVFYKVESPKKKLIAYQFNTISEEVEFVATEIAKLIKNGIDISRIKLANIDNDYIKEIRKIFNFFNIPVNLNEKVSLYDLNITKDFIIRIENGESLEEIILSLENKYSKDLINKLISVINEFPGFVENKKSLMPILKERLKRTFINAKVLNNAIEIIELYNNEIDDDTYVFLMGFNHKSIPKIMKDEDFISDKLKKELNLDTSIELNKMIKNATINICNSINNLVITYKLKTAFNDFSPSNLIKDFNIKVETPSLDPKVSYSKLYNDIKLGIMIDKLVCYGETDPNLDIMYNNSSFKYLTYDNKFKGIDYNDFSNYLNHKLNLSYSTLDKFYHCKFRYYLSNVLNIDTFDDTLAIKIGNVFHHILAVKDKENFDLDKLYEKELNDLGELTPKEKFYLNKSKEELRHVLDVLNYQGQLSGFNGSYYERKFAIDKSKKDIEITFKGFVDKILYTDKYNQKLISIIDYKTGNPKIDLRNLPNGLNMQLPIYIYLVKNSNEFRNARIAGIYLQHILSKVEKDGDIDLNYRNALKLQGYSNCDEAILEMFDTTYKNSEMISSMKQTNDGKFYSYSKILNDSEIENIVNIVDDKINSAIDDILSCDFSINPKRLNNEIIGCANCKFRDICYKTEKDYEDLNEYKDLSFLGGDSNA